LPPPPPAAAFAPPAPPSFMAPALVLPPPPARPPSRALPDSPFDPDMPTPPPPPLDEFGPPTPPSLVQPGPPRGAATLPAPGRSNHSWPPAAPVPAFAPGPSYVPALTLQQPDTIDFAADAQPIVMRRSGPPGLLVVAVLLGAMAGGAKLAEVVTRGDIATLDPAK
jgi:hypothetical protein